MRRESGRLVPIDGVSVEGLSKVREGEVVTVTLKKPRNPKLQAFYWAMLTKVAENQERYTSKDELHDVIRVEAGHRKIMFLRDGTEILVPDSTSFDDMDDLAFRTYVQRACDVVAKDYLIDVRDPNTRMEIEVMIGARAP